MQFHQNHIIDKVFFEVKTRSQETANSIKSNIDLFFNDELFPQFELLFEKYNRQDTIVRFDELNINISVDKWNNLEVIKYEICNQLEEKLNSWLQSFSNIENTEQAQILTPAKNIHDTFLFFLENGYLPWYGSEDHISEFAHPEIWKKSFNDIGFIQKINDLLVKNKGAAVRFIYQFPAEMTIAFLVQKNSKIPDYKKSVKNINRKLNWEERIAFFKFLFQLSIENENETWFQSVQTLFYLIQKRENGITGEDRLLVLSELKKLIQNTFSEQNLRDSKFINLFQNKIITDKKIIDPEPEILEFKSESGQDKEVAFFEKEENEIAVQNAGLVLIHPFLKQFFVETGIIDKQGILIKKKLDLAVQSVHYLATGNENVFEGNLVLEKFLCGVPLKMPVQKMSLLTDLIKNEAEILLKEVIRNWPALKNSSSGGLRQMFFHRDGKLIKKEKNCKLIVERKAQDVLLEKLPWNISMVKFPWKKKLLIVEW